MHGAQFILFLTIVGGGGGGSERSTGSAIPVLAKKGGEREKEPALE